MKSVFNLKDCQQVIERINQLGSDTKANWGKMNVSQMLAHCNVTYELVYTNLHPKPNLVMKFIVKLMAKSTVVGDKPYKKSLQTAPMFIIKDEKDFEVEKKRLIEHLEQTQQLGESHFEGKESHSFGVLSKEEWNNMFYKHLDHHLSQFGV
ncbi:MAG: DUF1569 domain-containing protein [Pelobium sp.]